MIDECKFEIKEDTFSVKMPLLSAKECTEINRNIDGFARAITSLVIVDKNMAIAQQIIRQQKERLELFEDKHNKALNYIYELKKQLTKELNYRSTAREAKIQLTIVDSILEILKGEKNE